MFSPDGGSAYQAIPELGRGGFGIERGAVYVYDRDPGTSSMVQKPGAAGCIAEGRFRGCAQGRALLYGFSLAISPDGRNLYAGTEDSVAVFDRDLAGGTLAQKAEAEGCVTGDPKRRPTCAQGRGLIGDVNVATSSDGKNVYAQSRQALAIFDRDPSSGSLVQKPGPKGLKQEGAGGGLVVSPDGKNVYTLKASGDNRMVVFDRDPVTGTLARKPGRAGCVSDEREAGCRHGRAMDGISDLDISPDGQNVYVITFGYKDSGSLAVFDRLPDGSLVQKQGRDGCLAHGIRGEGCAANHSLAGNREISIGADGRLVFVESVFGDPAVFVRHGSGALTVAPGF